MPTTSSDIPAVVPVIPVTTSNETITTEPPVATEQATTTSKSSGQTVYWLDGGEVYHLDRNCQHIRKYKDSVVRSGTIEESGKARACKSCS